MGSERRLTRAKRGANAPGARPTSEPVVAEYAVQSPSKTPLYQAYNASRYQRQALIKLIQDMTGRVLICYVSGKHAPIDRDDAIGFVDILHNIRSDCDLDLLLHTGGGD